MKENVEQLSTININGCANACTGFTRGRGIWIPFSAGNRYEKVVAANGVGELFAGMQRRWQEVIGAVFLFLSCRIGVVFDDSVSKKKGELDRAVAAEVEGGRGSGGGN